MKIFPTYDGSENLPKIAPFAAKPLYMNESFPKGRGHPLPKDSTSSVPRFTNSWCTPLISKVNQAVIVHEFNNSYTKILTADSKVVSVN